MPPLNIPAYFLHGRHDDTTSYRWRLRAADRRAGEARFYTFERSAHSPMVEEPERTRTILHEDVLMGNAWLADAG